MGQCKTCCGKGYTGFKRHEVIYGPATDKPCPDCSASHNINQSSAEALKIGTHRSASTLRNVLLQRGKRLNNYARDMLMHDYVVNVASRPSTVRLNMVPLTMFSCSHHNCTVAEVNRIGNMRGYVPCEPEYAVQYFLQRPGRQMWQTIVFCTRTIMYCGQQYGFIITNNAEGHVLRAVHTDARLLSQYPPFSMNPHQVMTVWRS